jgi:hypothetical protein
MDDADPYADGADACLAGKMETDTPYNPDVASELFAHCEWLAGWLSIYED